MITITATDTLTFKENRRLGIINFGEDNLYPNHTQTMSDNSGALKRCIQTKEKFIFGNGVTENNGFWKSVINPAGLRVDQLTRLITRQYSMHDGFAVHIGYNALLEKVALQVIPFENLRLPWPDDEGNITEIWYHSNWSCRRIEQKDIKVYNMYTTDKEVIMRQIETAGGFDKWGGHIMYFGEVGRIMYPHNSFHAVLEDVITDIKLKKGRNANVSTNFMPSAIIEFPFLFKNISPYPEDRKENSTTTLFKDEIMAALEKYQGNENLGKLMALENPSVDKDGKHIPFNIRKLDIQNFDKLFESTESAVKAAIRGIYNQPEILHDTVATGFSTEIMNDMYRYYNSITSDDRQIIEETMMELFSGWYYDINPTKNYSLKPLTFA